LVFALARGFETGQRAQEVIELESCAHGQPSRAITRAQAAIGVIGALVGQDGTVPLEHHP
jgi:hypothetical protein